MAVIGTPVNHLKSDSQIEQQVLEEIALEWAQTDEWPDRTKFRAARREHLDLLDDLESRQIICSDRHVTYKLPLESLAKTPHWPGDLFNLMLRSLQNYYSSGPNVDRPLSWFIDSSNRMISPELASRLLKALSDAGFCSYSPDNQGKLIATVRPHEQVLRVKSIEEFLNGRKRSPKPKLQALVAATKLTGDSNSFPIALHPKISKVSLKAFDEGDYRTAIMNAFTCVFDRIREKADRKEDGHDLINRVFSLTTPLLKLNGLESKSEKNEQAGLIDMLKGSYSALRSPRAHSLKSKLKDKNEAIECLALASLLMRWVERSKKSDSPR